MRNTITAEAIAAFDQEVKRVLYRLNLIKARALLDLATEMNQLFDLYASMSRQIEERMNLEKAAVQRLCTVLSRCVEREEKIQPALLLEKTGFTIHPNAIMFPDKVTPTTPKVEEPCPIEGFRVGQLGKLKDLLMGVAPLGIIPERAFVFIIADLISLIGFEIPGHSKLPQSWSLLQPPQIECLVERICGHSEAICWKDFILYNLEIDFPSMKEILHARKMFRNMDHSKTDTITREDYNKFKFWFESEIPPENPRERLKLTLIRELIFCLFEVAPNVLDYPGLLLNFCKDYDSRSGLAKAFALSLGSMVCYSEEEGRKYEKLMAGKSKQQQQIASESKAVGEENYERAVDLTVQLCEGVFIKDLHDPEEILRPIVDGALDNATDPRRLNKDDNDEEEVEEEEEEEEEEDITADNSLKYTICLTTVQSILTATLPWATVKRPSTINKKLVQNLRKTFINLGNPDGSIYIYKLLNSEFMKEIFYRYYKFKVKHPKYIIADILGSMPKNRYCN